MYKQEIIRYIIGSVTAYGESDLRFINLGNMINIPTFPPARKSFAGKNVRLLFYIILYFILNLNYFGFNVKPVNN